MVDLAYAALYFGDFEMAEEVSDLEERLSDLVHDMQAVCILAVRNPKEAEAMSSVLQVISAIERIADYTRGVPRVALALTALLVALLASVQALGSLFALSSAAVLVQYAMGIASLLRLALQGRVPRLAIVPAVFGLITLALLAKAVEVAELWILGAALLLGGALALGRARLRSVP